MLKWVVALAGLLLAVPVAQAASFDCAKASSAVEKAVCGDPELSQQDEILAQAYATALGGLSADAAAVVEASQHEWLDYAARICTRDAVPLAGAYDADGVSCLGATYRGRIKALEASRMQGGYRFYPIDLYLLEADPDAEIDAYITVADKQYATVRIDRADAVANAFNAMIDGNPAGMEDLFVPGTATLAKGDTSTDYQVTTEVKDITPHRIGLETTGSWYGHGAAHPNYWISYQHFLIEEKRALVASDIFAGEGWQQTLGKLVIARLKEKLGDDMWDDLDKDIGTWSADTSRWDFSEEGLIVQFQPYDVTAYAAGAPTVTIPWGDLGSILTENAEQLAYY